MDQGTQILLGSTAAQAFCGRRLGWSAAFVGGVAGFLPDADMALKPFADSLFPMEIHRSFSHALLVVPLGAALVTLLFLPFPPFRRHWPWVFLAAFLGWLSHAPLDACTSYGTKLLWPFDAGWKAWDVISIIDPVFTLILLVGLGLALRRRRSRPAAVALLLALAYIGVGWLQRGRALDAQANLAEARGHAVEHGRVIPVLGGLVFWRSLYVADGRIHADQLRLLPGVEVGVAEAGSVQRFLPDDLLPDLPDAATVRDVFGRYYEFADGFTARTPGDEEVVGDMRYSVGYAFDPAWGVRVVPNERPVWVERAHFNGPDVARLMGTMFGTAAPFVPLGSVADGPATAGP